MQKDLVQVLHKMTWQWAVNEATPRGFVIQPDPVDSALYLFTEMGEYVDAYLRRTTQALRRTDSRSGEEKELCDIIMMASLATKDGVVRDDNLLRIYNYDIAPPLSRVLRQSHLLEDLMPLRPEYGYMIIHSAINIIGEENVLDVYHAHLDERSKMMDKKAELKKLSHYNTPIARIEEFALRRVEEVKQKKVSDAVLSADEIAILYLGEHLTRLADIVKRYQGDTARDLLDGECTEFVERLGMYVEREAVVREALLRNGFTGNYPDDIESYLTQRR